MDPGYGATDVAPCGENTAMGARIDPGHGACCRSVAGRKSEHMLQWYTGRVSLSEASLPDADPRGNGHPSLGASYSVVGNARSAA